MSNVKKIVEAVKSVLPKNRPIEHHSPYYDLNAATRLIHKSLLLGLNSGYYKEVFKEKLAEITGAEQVVLTSSGTAALTIALRACGIGTHQNLDLVLVPSATFAATANAVHFAGAIPYFIDTYGPLTPERLREVLETTAVKRGLNNRSYRTLTKHTDLRVRAVIPVHLFGYPLDMEGIMKVADEYDLIVIEDAAQALGSKVHGKHVGTFGHAGILSFNNNKIVTTNGGGAIVTNYPFLSIKAYRLANTARINHPWLVEHDEMAYNARMGEINAALGVAQLDHFNETLELKRNLHEKYCVAVRGICELFQGTSFCNHWLNTILVDTSDRDEILKQLHNDNIGCRRMYTPLHRSKYYQYSNIHNTYWQSDSERDMSRCESFFERVICLPSSPSLAQ